MGFIFFLSSKSSLAYTINITYFDKIFHTGEYVILCLVVARAFSKTTKLSFNKMCLITVIICVLYGISDELHQYFVPNRECSYLDFVADAMGTMIGLFIYTFGSRKLEVNREGYK
ncbi:VanZ family protein [bacterium]|nr:VanZ family protein [bacterium]